MVALQTSIPHLSSRAISSSVSDGRTSLQNRTACARPRFASKVKIQARQDKSCRDFAAVKRSTKLSISTSPPGKTSGFGGYKPRCSDAPRQVRVESTAVAAEGSSGDSKKGFNLEDALEAGLGSVVLVAATVFSLLAANSSFGSQYVHLWETQVGPAALGLSMSLHHWVNEAVMAVFFFVVGAEIKAEFVAGSLSSIRKAALPCIAALGGMIVPIILYCACNYMPGGSPAGWAIPMATDIAFAMAVYGFFRNRVPAGVAAFLLTLATVDDLGAIAVIAVFFSHGIVPSFLIGAVAICGALYFLQKSSQDAGKLLHYYAFCGVALWYCLLQGGINADVAGVVTAMAIPGTATVESSHGDSDSEGSRKTLLLEHVAHKLTPLSSLIIMPLFALANCAVQVDPTVFSGMLHAPVSIGIAAGLMLGKPLGIAGFSVAGIKLGIASWPTGMVFKHLLAVGMLGGIGFTMSLFLIEQSLVGVTANIAKMAIITTSTAAALVGALILRSFPYEKTALSGGVDLPAIAAGRIESQDEVGEASTGSSEEEEQESKEGENGVNGNVSGEQTGVKGAGETVEGDKKQ